MNSIVVPILKKLIPSHTHKVSVNSGQQRHLPAEPDFYT